MVSTSPVDELYVFLHVTNIFSWDQTIISDVCALLYNPFGPRVFDINHDKNSSAVRKLGMSLATGVTVPSTLTSSSKKIDFTLAEGNAALLNMNDVIRRKRDYFTNGHRLLFSNFQQSTMNVRRSSVAQNTPSPLPTADDPSSSSDSEDVEAHRRHGRERKEKKSRSKSDDTQIWDDMMGLPPTCDDLHGTGDRKKKHDRKRTEPTDYGEGGD